MAATEDHLLNLQCLLDYRFKDFLLLQKALTAPGAEGNKAGNPEEQSQYDGNRNLAHVGNHLYRLSVAQRVLKGNTSRRDVHDLIEATGISLEQRAMLIGLYTMIRSNPRQRGVVNRRTLRLVFSAIVGAVWLDCDKDERVTTGVVHRLCIDPIPPTEVEETISLAEPEATAAEMSWMTVMDALPGSGYDEQQWSGSHNASSRNPYNTWPLIGNNFPQQASATEQHSMSLQSLSHPQHGTYLSSQSQIHDCAQPVPDFLYDATGLVNHMMESIDPALGSLSGHTPEITNQAIVWQEQGNTDLSQFSHVDATDEGIQQMTTHQISHRIEMGTVPAPATTEYLTNRAILAGPCSTQHVSISVASSSRKKRKTAASQIQDQDTISPRLKNYVELEKTRCQEEGLVFRPANFDTILIHACASFSRHEGYLSTLEVLFFGIGSSEAIVVLQGLLKTRRGRSADQRPIERHSLSLADRVRAITAEDEKNAFTSFRKRCHAYRLFVDSSPEGPQTLDSFVVNTAQSMATRQTGQVGNPLNLELSRVSSMILSQLYPNLEPGDKGYRTKKMYVDGLRKLGQRLHLLVEKFGRGIMGLIPLPGNHPSLADGLNVTDEAIMRIPDNQFKRFLVHLDELFGDYLREISIAVAEVVEFVFNGGDHFREFSIERCEQTQIVQHPRGSLNLLQMMRSPQPVVEF